MKILVIGSGGREHALAWALRQSPTVTEVLVAPGNPGTALVGRNVPDIRSEDTGALLELARREAVDLTVVGPEGPLVEGLADRFRAAGLAVFGPDRAAARLEGSKSFSKEFMARHRIPTAGFQVFEDALAAHRHVDAHATPIVLKADGLAAGKGVTVALTRAEAHAAIEQIMEARVFGAAGSRLVIEEFMAGEEASLFVLCDGQNHLPFVAAQDHKRAFDGDRGPNTGGMGAFAPAALISRELLGQINEQIVTPTLAGLRAEGAPYQGLLYVGLMISPSGPQVVEYNCRFGDPETQALLPLLESDLAPLLLSAATGTLGSSPIRWKSGSSVCLVLASRGYPGPCDTGLDITGIADAESAGALVFHAATAYADGTPAGSADANENGASQRLVTAGGRVLNVCVAAPTLGAALETAYTAASRIRFSGMHYRRDIGRRALGRSDSGGRP